VSGKIGGNGQNGGLELETGTLRHLLGIRFGSSFVWFGCNHAILASIELKQYFSFPFPLCRLCYFPRDAPKNTIYISTFVGCRLLGEFTIYRVPFAPVSGNPLFLAPPCGCVPSSQSLSRCIANNLKSHFIQFQLCPWGRGDGINGRK